MSTSGTTLDHFRRNPGAGFIGPDSPLPDKWDALYTRVSTQEAADGQSLDTQFDDLMEFHEETEDLRGFPIVEYQDPGHTGFKFNRPGLNSIFQDIREGKVRNILVRDVKRYGRNCKEGLGALDDLLTFGVRVYVKNRPHLDYATTDGKKDWASLLADAQCERGINRDNSVSGQARRSKLGKWKGGPAPVGYHYVSDEKGGDGFLHKLEPAASVVLKVGEEFVKRKSRSEVLRALHAENIKTVVGDDGSEQLISLQLIERILDNPVNAGFNPAPRELSKKAVPDLVIGEQKYFKPSTHHEQIFSDDLWEKIQSLRARARRKLTRTCKNSPEFAFQGRVVCDCGELMRVAKAKGGEVRYYSCAQYVKLGGSCECKTRLISAVALESAVFDFLGHVTNHPDVIQRIVASSMKADQSVKSQLETGIDERSRAISKNEVRIQTMRNDAWGRRLEGTALGKDMLADYEKLSAQTVELRSELTMMRTKLDSLCTGSISSDEVTDGLGNFKALVHELAPNEIKTLVEQMISSIKVKRIHNGANKYPLVKQSSAVIEAKISLTTTGLKLAAKDQLKKNANPNSESELAPIPLVFEVRRGGTVDVRLLSPMTGRAEIMDFPNVGSQSDSEVPQDHALATMDRVLELRKNGMLKKDIAVAIGKKPPMVTYYLTASRINATLLRRLRKAPASILHSFGIVKLKLLGSIRDPGKQRAEFERTYREASPTQPS